MNRVKLVVAVMCAGAVLFSCAKKEETAAGDVFTDSRDGQSYRTVTIGALTWMAQNLNYNANGSHCYDDDPKNCEKFGRLYSWDAARTACPAGWRLADNDDWSALANDVGEGEFAVNMLMSKTGWGKNEFVSITDEFGFSALPGGMRDSDGNFKDIGERGNWWTGTMVEGSAFYWSIYSYRLESLDGYEGNGFSVRCVTDAGQTQTQETEEENQQDEFAQFIPSGYIILSDTTGDLNRDGIDDRVFLVASRNNESLRDGVVITFCFEPQGCEVVSQNLNLFNQCERDGTQLCNVKIERNNLKLVYEDDESKKTWTFRLSANGFELIGYDEEFAGSEGFYVTSISVNHLTRRKLTKTMTNAEDFYSDNFRPRFNEEWEDVVVENLFVLSEETNDLINVTGYRAAPVRITAGAHTFNAVTIANTMWMSQNLNIDVEGARCYQDNPANCAALNCGRLYQWETAYNLCANLGDGWRLPHDADWTELIEIGGLNDPNIFGFEIEFCGYHNVGFSQFNERSQWWSATEISGSTARASERVRYNARIDMGTRDKTNFLSVRCVKDLSD